MYTKQLLKGNWPKMHKHNFAEITILHGGSFLQRVKTEKIYIKNRKKIKHKLIKKQKEKKATDQR